MGLRLLFLGLAIWALAAIVRHLYRQRSDSAARPTRAVQDMVRCARCGVHLPKADALRQGEDYFCCEQHQSADSRRGEDTDVGGPNQ